MLPNFHTRIRSMIITSNKGTKPNRIYMPNRASGADEPVIRTTAAIDPTIMAMIPAIKKRVQF
ncbi:hypothetical protein EMIT036CA2_50344 [Chryseobacterium sp. IT-36CA2]